MQGIGGGVICDYVVSLLLLQLTCKDKRHARCGGTCLGG